MIKYRVFQTIAGNSTTEYVDQPVGPWTEDKAEALTSLMAAAGQPLKVEITPRLGYMVTKVWMEIHDDYDAEGHWLSSDFDEENLPPF